MLTVENSEMSRKRERSLTNIGDIEAKRPRISVNSEDSEFRSDFVDKLGQKNVCKTKQCINLIGLMYQVDLSVLCLIRKLKYKRKYPSLSLVFESSERGKFNNITLRHKDESIYVLIEHVDKYYIDNDIGYARLFTKEKRGSYINILFNSLVEHQLFKLDASFNEEKYFIIYTNSGLDLTEEMELKRKPSRNFYPFKFECMNVEEYGILKDFLFTNNNIQGCGFYQFSHNKRTRKELLRRLEFSSAMRKAITEREISQKFEKRMKKRFLDKLVFVVNQPNREELNSIVKNEIENSSKVKDDYMTLQERVLCDLAAPEKLKKLGYHVPEIVFKFNLLLSFMHDMFLHKNISSINSKSNGGSDDIIIHYKDKIVYIKALYGDGIINYSHLLPTKVQERKNKFSINKNLTFFIEELEKDKEIKYFIIYTQTGIDLTEENMLKKGQSKNFHSLKLDNLDIQNKKFKILRYCSCIDANGLYQFSQEETTKLSSLLKLPPSFGMEKVREQFLSKLIFAVNQPNMEELNAIIKNEIENKSNEIPYSYEELHEIALRWSESHGFGPITKDIMVQLMEDIQNNRYSYQGIQKEIIEEIKFAKSVVGKEGTPAFFQFLNFISKGEGTKYLAVMKSNGINLSNVSNILNGARANGAKAFKDLYNLWFDERGNKTRYLETLEKEGMNLSNMSSVLGGAGANAVRAYKDLYNLWFDEEGNKTKYLQTVEEEGMNLCSMSGILSGSRANAATAFKGLYDLWFDNKGNKTKHLKTLEKEGVNLSNMSSILSGARASAAKAFKELYDLWFDAEGNKTQNLTTLESEGINLSNMSSILSGARGNAAKAFKDLYDLWFDADGSKTQCLKVLEKEGVNLSTMSSILSGAAANAARAFKDLYDLWFDAKGRKTVHLKTLQKEQINLSSVSNILHRAGTHAAKAFKGLYDLWFDKEANKTRYLKTLEEEGIHLYNMSSILGGAGAYAPKAFKELYDLWFTAEGSQTHYLKTLEKEGISLSNMSGILGRVGVNASKAFKKLYYTFFDEHDNKKQHLKHFIRRKGGGKSFTMHNVSSILGGAGAKAKDAFESLHNVCFNSEGKRTELLDDFYEAGFKPSNLSCLLCRSGVRASSIMKKFHSVCFNKKREKTKLLEDFFSAGFSPYDLCNILSAAADSIEKFHDFCFVGKSKEYLSHFLDEKEGFTLTALCNILHGAKANVCPMLKDFHDVCFDERGSKTKLLMDFYKAGFRWSDLSNILSMAGNNAISIFKKFHRTCFNKKNYLNHFLSEEKLFKPKDLSKILYGVGINICLVFEKLHDLCFDEAGNKTSFMSNLIRGNPLNKISDILYEKVRGSSPNHLNEQDICEGDQITNLKSDDSNMI